jgi:hypothetical protein
MDYLNLGYELAAELVGPRSVVPWWAWAALLTMIFGGLLGPVFGAGDPDEPLQAKGLPRLPD